MKIIETNDLDQIRLECARPAINNEDLWPVIDEIFNEVKEKGDEALKKYTHFFDRVDLDSIKVPTFEFESAINNISNELAEAIEKAAKNIERFHESQRTVKSEIETSNGVFCWQEFRPIQKIGIYIPGGTAPLFSTVLMLGIPAKIAGCEEIILCTPPNKEGEIAPEILFAADLCGINKVMKIGGAQAIAAMTFGTKTVSAVSKIFGPGNQYVTAAKMKAQQFGLAIDMPAGPSELMVVCDDSSNPSFVAADLLSQAEHGSDSQVICVLENRQQIDLIQKEIENQLKSLPRKNIALKALNNSRFIIAQEASMVVEIINDYAPEHLILATYNNRYFVDRVTNAGSVFLGNYTPESAGDYASGTNHTLPTNGFAKAFSGVNLDAFGKKITYQQISEEGILELGPTIEIMADAEGLSGHKNAVTLRLKSLL